MAYVDKYRNEEEKKQAIKEEIIDIEDQIKRTEPYLKRLRKRLRKLKYGI
jgi:hypothetical protein